jgi:hypothetical protein
MHPLFEALRHHYGAVRTARKVTHPPLRK